VVKYQSEKVMKIFRIFSAKIIMGWLFFFSLFGGIRAQSETGQYTEEAPTGSWNLTGPFPAPSLGTGFSQILSPETGHLLFSNPAALGKVSVSRLSLNLSFNQTQLFRYWLVNTGVLTTSENLTFRYFRPDFISFSYRFRKLVISVALAAAENYGRPPLDYRYVQGGITLRQLKIWQTGTQTRYALSVAKQLSPQLSLGLSLVWNSGFIERNLEEKWPPDQIEMSDYRYQKTKGFCPVFGVNYRLSERVEFGFSLTPSTIFRATGHSLLSYITPLTRIEIPAQSSDRIKRPFSSGLGTKLTLKPNLNYYLEATYLHWNSYSFEYFGETQARNFRNILRLGSGVEYRTEFKFLGRTWSSPYYFGFCLDPQPITDIPTTYYYLTFGSGIGNEWISFLFATALGLEKGSGRNLKTQKISLTLVFHQGKK